MRRHFSFLTATDQTYSPQANSSAQLHQWAPTFINKGNKTKIFASSFYSFSRKFTFRNAQCEAKEKNNLPKISFTGTMSLLREREL